jgi:hypothetical protein
MARAINWKHYEQLKAEGLADREIARRWGIPWTTFHREKQRYIGAHPSTPAIQPLHTQVRSSTPGAQPTIVYPSTPALQSIRAHPSTPIEYTNAE